MPQSTKQSATKRAADKVLCEIGTKPKPQQKRQKK